MNAFWHSITHGTECIGVIAEGWLIAAGSHGIIASSEKELNVTRNITITVCIDLRII